MGKTKAKVAPIKRDLSEEDGKLVASLKKAGNDAFGAREYPKALDTYEKALKMLPPDHLEAALLHSNKAACNMMLKRYKEAINECTSALETQPTYHKALARRAKAYENIGHYKAALGDVHIINRGEGATQETEETERRLKDILAGKKATSGAVVAAPALVPKKKSALARAQQGSQPPIFHAKCMLGDESRLIPLNSHCSVVELMHNVRVKFPGVGPFVLKYLDRDADLVTLMSRQDLARAMNEAVLAVESMTATGHGPRLTQQMQQMLPPVQVQVVQCAVSEVPDIPLNDEEELFKQLRVQAQLYHQLEEQFAPPKAAVVEPEAPQMMELDSWIVDFAHLFREHCGLDIDKHLDLNNVAWDRIQSALEATIGDEKALPLLEEAEKKFLETSAHGMQQVGNVSVLRAKQLLDKAVLDGDSVESVREQVEEQFLGAENRFKQSLTIKADFVDGFLCLADLEMQRAKLAQGFHAPLPRGPTREEQEAAKAAGTQQTDAEINAETQKLATEINHAALGKLTAEAAGKGAKHWKLAYENIQAAIDSIPQAERTVKALPEQPKDGEPLLAPDEPISLYQNALLAWGNLLYEESQLAAGTGSDWRLILDDATARFREAGCNELDITGALRNHLMVAELGLPEPAVAAPPAEAAPPPTANGSAPAEAAEKVAVKGLGASLGPAPKKKAAKEATA